MGARFRSILSFAASAAVLTAAGPAFAQAPTPPVSPPALKLPSVTFSIGTGVAGRDSATTAAARYALDRHLAIEGNFARWTGADRYSYAGSSFGPGGSGYSGDWRSGDDRSAWLAGASLLFQTTYRRVSWFGGAGLGYAVMTEHTFSTVDGCISPPGSSYYCYSGYDGRYQNRGWTAQAQTGADVRIAGPVVAYGSLQFTGSPVGYLTASAGVRVVARSVSAARLDSGRVDRLARSSTPRVPGSAAIGARVRVTLETGEQRTGTLLSLTGTEVVLRAKTGLINESLTQERYKTANVRLVETTSHTFLKGMFWGLAAGAAFGVALSGACEDDFGYCAIVFGPTFAGLGAASGAAIGGLIDHLAAPSHVVYAKGDHIAQLIPVVATKGGGLGIRVRW